MDGLINIGSRTSRNETEMDMDPWRKKNKN